THYSPPSLHAALPIYPLWPVGHAADPAVGLDGHLMFRFVRTSACAVRTAKPAIVGHAMARNGTARTGRAVGTAVRRGQRRSHTWVRPSSEKPMKPRTSSFSPPSAVCILTE